ncbi:flavin-containing monooxygenase [Mycobacteroides salmoniphilum]|uniref:4-hydroxyacetophenone monooxygenase n=1 Tax=Mycobacteroides salmoniphilum TaxID=404941 RepID=A0A4R8SU51_9MYCO|nr:NAD(P)/FAD-dependent oxidoreductase [Mycobacteroides salmoniphilum]TEA03741.1 4-hydroxyacetophenone monooxygenase [Mycobacteroides salmoniphilum]
MTDQLETPHTYTTLIIGAGFSGLGAAHKLIEAGIDNIVMLERSDRLGGTWRDNTYPGAAVDIPSMLYSFSFAPNPRWSRVFAPAGELREHIDHLADKFGVRQLIRFNQEVTALDFLESQGIWRVSTSSGIEYRARTIITATGPLSDSSLPAMRGMDTFEGHKIHSAKWDHDYDMRGKHVAVIGTGASAIQIIPELVKTAASVKVFQRTAGWVMPRPNVAVPRTLQRLYAAVPATQRASRAALYWGHEVAALGLVWNTPVTGLLQKLGLAHLRTAVRDPWLRRQLTPNFRAGCKRMLISSDYYPALQRDNCKLITWPIATMSPKGIRSSEGIEHEVDCIVFATGYDVHLDGPPFPVTGLGGRSLKEKWNGHAHGYKSAHTAGFPNLFLTNGPNSGPGHNSLLVYLEAQIAYAVQGIRTIVDRDLLYLDVREEVERHYNASMQKRLKRTTWMSGCQSWYLTADGFNGSMYPGFATQYRKQMHDFQLNDYRLVPQLSGAHRAVSEAELAGA